MHRRDLLARLAIGGAGAVLGRSGIAAPLRRVTVALLDEPEAAAAGDCSVDSCSTRDACPTGDAGHTCHQRDVCAVDESGDCTRDECTQADASSKGAACTDDRCDSDSSGACTTDTCTSDSSGTCAGDTCTSDKSGECTGDTCISDKSGECTDDECESDSSNACQSSDNCYSDSSGECAGDECRSDASGGCTPSDACVSDSSKDCVTDSCVADSSGECTGADSCVSDSSGECSADECTSDKSGECGDDACVSDKSGSCTANDTCVSDSSQVCGADECVSDASGACGDDGCRSDSSGACAGDRCLIDSSADCTQADVCVLDSSQTCVSDLCRRDTNLTPCTEDSCAPDLQALSTRRSFTRLGRALRWLYEIGAVVALCLAIAPPAAARDVIHTGCAATFYPRAVTLTATPVSPGTPKGPFLADFDGDGILEADTDGDGLDAADPEVADRDGDGTRDLPPGTTFAGTRRYTIFWVPDDVVIAATGFLKVMVTSDVRVFGALRLAAGAEIAARGVIDVRTSAWLAETGEVKLTSALAGDVMADSDNCTGVDATGADFLGPVIDTDLDGALDADEGLGDSDGDTVPDWQDQDTASLPSPNGAGIVAADVAEGAAQRLDFTLARVMPANDPSLPEAQWPATGIFLFGVQELRVNGLDPGETVTMTLRLPIPVPPGSQYWRADATGWHQVSLGSNNGDATVTVSLTDGGADDRDGIVNGAVSELGGVVFIPRRPSSPVRRHISGGS